MSTWHENLDRIVLKDLELRIQWAEYEDERKRIERLRQRWMDAMSEFRGAAAVNGGEPVPIEDPA